MRGFVVHIQRLGPQNLSRGNTAQSGQPLFKSKSKCMQQCYFFLHGCKRKQEILLEFFYILQKLTFFSFCYQAHVFSYCNINIIEQKFSKSRITYFIIFYQNVLPCHKLLTVIFTTQFMIMRLKKQYKLCKSSYDPKP